MCAAQLEETPQEKCRTTNCNYITKHHSDFLDSGNSLIYIAQLWIKMLDRCKLYIVSHKPQVLGPVQQIKCPVNTRQGALNKFEGTNKYGQQSVLVEGFWAYGLH